MNKIKYIILTIGLLFFLGFLIAPMETFSSGEVLDYRCHTCNSAGKCTENVYSKPCSDDCSGCQKHTCKICSGTTCKSKTFDSPCSNNCETDSGCGAGSTQDSMSCKVCSEGQCVSKMFQGLNCTDECTGAENCGGTTPTTEEEDDGPGWSCQPQGNCASGTCTGKCEYLKHGGDYSTEEKCEKNCCFCCICRNSYNIFAPGKVCRCEGCKKGCTGCKTDADCESGGTPPTTQKYTCSSASGCIASASGTYTSSNCDNKCVKRCVGSTCQYNDNTVNKTCTSNANCVTTPSCSVKATANPNPIPEGQNQVTISATNLNHTSLSKCKVSNYSLPHTFTQDVASKTYTVKCTGNSGYDDCSSKITVTKGGGNGGKYTCSSSGCVASASGTYTSSNCDNKCVKRCVGSTCQYNDNTANKTCTSNADCVTTPTTEEPPRCQIFNFQVPHHAWIGYDSLAEWTTNNICTWAEITCKLDDGSDCGDKENLSGEVLVGFDQEQKFRIFDVGIYQYQLKACVDKNQEETCVIWEDVLGTGLDYVQIQALNLPIWQEINPVLPD
jgi:hypothetical protein